MRRATTAVLVAMTLTACSGGGHVAVDRTSTGHLAASAAQALRACVDRWNQGNMLGWGPTLAHVSARPRCTVSLAVHYRRDPQGGCSGRPRVPGYPGVCLDRTATYTCVIDRFGGYECPTNADTAQRPLRDENAVADGHGVVRLDVSLEGTQPAPQLAWQRRYPHVDGWVEPWTRAGALRDGLTFTSSRRGTCSLGSEHTAATSAIRCRFGFRIVDPCFPQRSDWNRHGGVAACPTRAGETTFMRFVISRHS